MAIDRAKEKEPEINQNSISSYIKLIDQTIADIYLQLLFALNGGSLKPGDTKSVDGSLFKCFWKKLDEKNNFQSLKELDTHFFDFSKKLDHVVAEFFELPKNKPLAHAHQQKLPDKKKLFLELIKLYHALTKIKFFLSKIELLDLKKEYDAISYEFPYPTLDPIRETIALLDVLNEAIPARLFLSGYSKTKPVAKKIKNSDEELLTFIADLLARLPTKDELNKNIKELQQALQLRRGINENKTKLNEHIIQIQETKKMISQKINSFYQKEMNLLNEMAEERSNIKIRMIEMKNPDYFRILNVLTSDEEKKKLQELFSNVGNVCKEQSEQLVFNGPWEETSAKLKSIYKNLDDNYNILMKLHITNIHKMVVFLRALNSRIAQLDEVSQPLEEKLNELRDTWLDSDKSLTRVEDTLMAHLNEPESLLTYCSSFLSRHWWKLLLGGAGGGGGSGGLSVLMALKGGPLALFCVIGTLVGLSLGAGSGLANDHFCPGKESKEKNETDYLLTSDEREHELIFIGEDILSDKKPNKGRWSFSIWKDQNDKIDEKPQNEFKLKPLGIRY